MTSVPESMEPPSEDWFRAHALERERAIVHGLLDVAKVDRQNRSESKAASEVYSLAQRVELLVGQRDASRHIEDVLRDSHKALLARTMELQRKLDHIIACRDGVDDAG